MKKLSIKEKVLNSKRQLHEYLKFSPDERLINYYKLKHSIIKLYNIILTYGLTVNELFDFDKISSDHLFMDIELIPYYSSEDLVIQYIRYDFTNSLPYPCGEYEVIDPICGKYKQKENMEYMYSERLAIDYTLKSIAQRWYDYIPAILKLIDQKDGK